MSDSLGLLREYNLENKEIIEKDGKIIFGENFFPKDWKTHCAMSRPGNDGEKEYYTLNCLLFFLKNKELVHPVYCNEAAANGIATVRRPDRHRILKYLNGEADNMPLNGDNMISMGGKYEPLETNNIQGKRPNEDSISDEVTPAPKRSRVRGKRTRNRKKRFQ